MTPREIQEMVRAGMTMEQMSRETKLHPKELRKMLRRSQLSHDAGDPTIQEIREAAKQIRSEWSPATEQARWVGLKGYLRSPR